MHTAANNNDIVVEEACRNSANCRNKTRDDQKIDTYNIQNSQNQSNQMMPKQQTVNLTLKIFALKIVDEYMELQENFC